MPHSVDGADLAATASTTTSSLLAARFGVANGGVDQRWGLIGLDLDKFFLFLKIIFYVGWHK
jgi:hypothetical protein